MKPATQTLYDNYILPTYARFPVCFVKGQGVYLFDDQGKKYLDFAAGIGVNSLGTGHPLWLEAINKQAAVLAHVSNLYYTEPAALLAKKLCDISGMKRAFFSNSGAEANEGAIKTARKYSYDTYGKGRSTIATLVQSFHGRTITTLAATGQESFHDFFFPFTEGFIHVPAGNIQALENLGEDICAVMIECIQGEGGVIPLSNDYLKQLEVLCRKRDWLLIVDEVQSGIGRTGSWFAYQEAGIKPDIVTFAKGISGGLPFGGFLSSQRACQTLKAGHHATTFGANPICAAAALAVLDVLEPLLPQIKVMGSFIQQEVSALKIPIIREIRGRGLMLGITITGETSPRTWVEQLLEAGLVTLTAGQDTIRLLPPLIITEKEIEEGIAIFKKVM